MTTRTRAADSFEEIGTRMEEIRRQAEPKCPMNPQKRLHFCLREPAPCPAGCPNVHDWMGPEA